jgi:serine protease Do
MRGFGEIAERLRRCTVQVSQKDRGGAGSGVVWSSDGVLLTNAHVARGSEAQVQLWNGRRFDAQVAARDGRRDLAQLRIAASGLDAVTTGDSRSVRPGEIAIAIGNPLGFSGALSTGVIHSTGPITGMGRFSWIRADVQLAPGNSGGPLANARGEIIGINTAIVNGLGLAIPSNDVADFVRRGARPSLGVVLRPVRMGLEILEVDPAGAAAAASLRAGDVLLGSMDDLSDTLDSGGKVARVRFLRGGVTKVREAYVSLGGTGGRDLSSAAAA